MFVRQGNINKQNMSLRNVSGHFEYLENRFSVMDANLEII